MHARTSLLGAIPSIVAKHTTLPALDCLTRQCVKAPTDGDSSHGVCGCQEVLQGLACSDIPRHRPIENSHHPCQSRILQYLRKSGQGWYIKTFDVNRVKSSKSSNSTAQLLQSNRPRPVTRKNGRPNKILAQHTPLLGRAGR
jgi:hypothetical protein